MLVICANDAEVQAFATKVMRYKYSKNNRKDYCSLVSKKDGKQIVVVTGDNLNSIPQQHYGLIQFKGHTKDMNPLLQSLKRKSGFIKTDKTILLLGGCDSDAFKPEAERLGAIPITNKHIGQSAHNDYLSLQLHSKLSTMSLASAIREIQKSAPDTYDQYIWPALN